MAGLAQAASVEGQGQPTNGQGAQHHDARMPRTLWRRYGTTSASNHGFFGAARRCCATRGAAWAGRRGRSSRHARTVSVMLALRAVAERPGLGVAADQQGQLDAGSSASRPGPPQLGAAARRGVVAALRRRARIAEGLGGDAEAAVGVEGLVVDAEPVAQAVAGRIGERQAAFMHPAAGGLAADQQPGFRKDVHHGARRMRQLAEAGPAGADVVQNSLKAALHRIRRSRHRPRRQAAGPRAPRPSRPRSADAGG
jgi:hypothetical protein